MKPIPEEAMQYNDVFLRQYLRQSGFCAVCGDAIHPIEGWEFLLGDCKGHENE